MPYLIFRSTRREREERLAESRAKPSGQKNIEGVVRTTEEAFELSREREREGYEFKRSYAVSGDAPESKLAEAELMARAGVPEEIAYHEVKG